MNDLIPRTQILRIVDFKLKTEEILLKKANSDFRKRVHGRSVAVLRELKDMYEHCEVNYETKNRRKDGTI